MCIRDRLSNGTMDLAGVKKGDILCAFDGIPIDNYGELYICLLYTSDAADEEDSVDLGGRRIIKKKIKRRYNRRDTTLTTQ